MADVDGGASGSEDFGEFSGFEFGVEGDGFHAVVEGLDHAPVVTDPDAVADVFGGNVIVGFLPFDVAVPVDAALAFGEAGEEVAGQGLEDGLFDVGEVGSDLAAGGAVDAGVGDVGFPVTEVDVEGVEVGEGFGFEGAFADVADVAFDFAFVLRGVGLGGERDESVVPAEGGEFRVEFGVVEVGFEDAGFEVVQDEGARDAAEVAQGVFEAPDEAFGVLAGHGFGVSFARVAQGDAQEVDFTPLPSEGEGGGAVVDLGFFAGFALHAPDGFLRVGIGGFESGDEAFDRGVTEAEVVPVDEVLPDAFGVEALGELLFDGLAEGITGTFLGARRGRGGLGAGGRGGTLWIVRRDRPGGRGCFGRFSEVALDGPAVDAEFARDLALAVSPLVQGLDGLLCCHGYRIGHDVAPAIQALRSRLFQPTGGTL